MASKNIYKNVRIGNVEYDPISVEVTEGYQQVTSRCTIELEDISGINLNERITIDIGYEDSHGVVFIGYVNNIETTRPLATHTISGQDILKYAIETWLVSTNIEEPWGRRNIAAENLVRDLLAEAGITEFSGDTTSFTFGVQNNAEFNLMSVWDAIRLICNILAYNCWARDDEVYFYRVLPYPSPGSNINHSITVGDGGTIITSYYGYSTEELRNRVVVFGKNGIRAEAKEDSPYLPSGFYKTAIVSSELIDSQGMANDSAHYNLNLYNKLTENMRVETEGDHRFRIHDIIGVSEPFLGKENEKWFLYAVTHRIGNDGFTSTLTLTR